MTNVIYAILVLGVMGGLFGLLLAVASKVFAVEKDERLEPIIEALPGATAAAAATAAAQAMRRPSSTAPLRWGCALRAARKVWIRSPRSWGSNR